MEKGATSFCLPRSLAFDFQTLLCLESCGQVVGAEKFGEIGVSDAHDLHARNIGHHLFLTALTE
jgi:hypothetical protein